MQAGTRLTYTLRITNTGNVTLTAVVTDVLSSHVAPTGALTWTPTIAVPGGVWTQVVAVTVNQGYAGPLSNTVWVTTEEGATGTSSVTVTVTPTYYLPLVLRNP